MDATLTQREFDTWREGDNQFKSEMRDFIAAQVQLNLTNEKRLTGVEERQASGERRTVWIASIISSVIAAFAGFFGAKV